MEKGNGIDISHAFGFHDFNRNYVKEVNYKMKKRKRTSIVLCGVLLACICMLLTGCGTGDKTVESSSQAVVSTGDSYADSPYVGTWAAKVAEYEGKEYDAEEVIGATSFVFNADGTGTFIGDGLTADIEWEPTKDGLKFTDFGGEESFTYQDGKLLLPVQLEDGGSITAYFEKQK